MALGVPRIAARNAVRIISRVEVGLLSRDDADRVNFWYGNREGGHAKINSRDDGRGARQWLIWGLGSCA